MTLFGSVDMEYLTLSNNFWRQITQNDPFHQNRRVDKSRTGERSDRVDGEPHKPSGSTKATGSGLGTSQYSGSTKAEPVSAATGSR